MLVWWITQENQVQSRILWLTIHIWIERSVYCVSEIGLLMMNQIVKVRVSYRFYHSLGCALPCYQAYSLDRLSPYYQAYSSLTSLISVCARFICSQKSVTLMELWCWFLVGLLTYLILPIDTICTTSFSYPWLILYYVTNKQQSKLFMMNIQSILR